MISSALYRIPALAAAVTCFFGAQVPAYGFLNLFKKSGKVAPNQSERQTQEVAASAMLSEAREAEATGSTGRAEKIYSSIVKQYPFTNSASEAAFSKALIVRQGSQLQDAFDAFQSFINDFRQSPRFADGRSRRISSWSP
jgi:outer membrane protein assembly factor BamD (BamD/ComL family)